MATMINLNDLIKKAKSTKNPVQEMTKALVPIAPMDEIQAAILSIMNLDGIKIELCGKWIWVSGETKANREALKKAGYKWASKKMMWYFRKPEDAKRYKGKSRDMAYIRDKYGSEEIK